MNTLNYHLANIAMPEAPLWLGINDEVLDNAEIELILNSNIKVLAHLVHFNYSEKYLVYKGIESNENTRIEFDDFLYLVFLKIKKYQVDDVATVFKNSAVKLPSWNENYKLILKSGDVLEGVMKACLADDSGIHIFKTEAELITRYFISHKAVESSTLGNKLGDELLSRNVVKAKQISKALHDQSIYKNKMIGEYLVERKIINEQDLQKVLDIQTSVRRRTNKKLRIGDILIQENILTRKQFENALKSQNEKRSAKIGDILIDMGYASGVEIHRIMADKVSAPLVLIGKYNVNANAIKLIPYEFSKKYSVFPLDFVNDRLLIAFSDPMDSNVVDKVKLLTKSILEIAISPKQDIENALIKFYGSDVIENSFDELEQFHYEAVSENYGLDISEEHYFDFGNAKPVINIVDHILRDAIAKGVSHIHIRPGVEVVDLLYRVNNSLTKQFTFHIGLLAMIIVRLKVIGEMDISETKTPLTGSAFIDVGEDKIKLTIAIMPSLSGESVVVRLDNKSNNLLSINDLGFSEFDTKTMHKVLRQKNGLILVIGPKRTGKTNTLYAVIRDQISNNKSVTTIENPVDLQINGVVQIDIQSFSGNPLALVLRNLLSHDPDVIMIDEPLNSEAGRIVINNASRDHLVMASMETKGFAETVKSLIGSGVDITNLSNTLSAVLVQRLARKNCQNCLELEDFNKDIFFDIANDGNEKFYHGIGCDTCNGTGFKGDILVYELIEITTNIRELIVSGVDINEIYLSAINEGLLTLSTQALALARSKDISLTEAGRISINL